MNQIKPDKVHMKPKKHAFDLERSSNKVSVFSQQRFLGRAICAFMACPLFLVMACSPLNLQPGSLSSLWAEEDGVKTDFSDFHRILKRTGCQDFPSYVWNYIYKIASIEDGPPPPYHTVKEKIVQRIQNLMKDHPADKKDINNFALRFVEIYALVTEFMEQYGETALTDTLVQFEYGIESGNHPAWTRRLKAVFAELDNNAKTLNNNCQEEEPLYTPNFNYRDETYGGETGQIHPLVYGARKVMATAYQSCSVLDIPAMPLNQSTKGISIHSRHSSGVGYKRVISNLNALNRSHYYLRNTQVSQNPQCRNIHQSPLIYDYGGKPSTSKNSINLFKNAGSGSRALGVDCSGFVASAMASAGLRLKPRVFIRSVHVKAVNSWMLKTAHRNQLTCLREQDISAENPLQPGDIIASSHHTVIVDSIGADPLGIKQVQSADQCHSRRINTRQFDFTVMQSSAHNNGTGINKMHIQDSAEGAIKRGMERVASRACYKMFGKDTHSSIKEVSILRHASEDPACRNREIYMEHEECIKDCVI